MSETPQESPEPDVEPHPLLLVLEEHMTKDQPAVLDEEAHYILQYATRLLIALWQTIDASVKVMIENGKFPMAITMLGALGSKVRDLKRYSYGNFKNLKSWESKISNLQRRLKRKLAERGSDRG